MSLINPLSGEGIFYAVLSGTLAGHAAALALDNPAADPGAAYRAAMDGALRWHLRATDALHWLLRRPWLLDASIRAAADRQSIFDELVRLSLADGTMSLRLAAEVRRRVAR